MTVRHRDEPNEERRRRYRLGHWSERLAEALLRIKGYAILDRRFRTPVGEIDIVARRRGVVAFVEVKARAGEREAVESISVRSQQRIRRAAELWLKRHPRCAGLDVRFDVVLVMHNRLPQHRRGIFDHTG